MRKAAALLLIAALCACGNHSEPPPAPQVQNGLAFFDYLDSDLQTFAVLRFEMQLDGGQYVSLGIPPIIVSPGSTPGAQTYIALMIPGGVPPGAHRFNVRACNAAGCGKPSPDSDFAI